MYNDKKNSVWLSIQYISTLIFSFITLKLNLLSFGQQLFGIWLLFASFWGISSVIDLGFGTALIRYIAEAVDRKDNYSVNRIVSTGFFIFILLGIILFLLGNIMGVIIYFKNYNIISGNIKSQAKLVFVFLGISFFLRYLTSYFRSIFEGLKNFVLPSKLNLIYNCLILCSVIIVFVFKLDLVSLAFAYLLSSIVIVILHYVFLTIKYKEIKISRVYLKFRYLSSLFKFSISVQAASVFGALIDPMIKYLVGNFISIETVSSYEVARRFSVAISGLFATSFRTILPKASVLRTRDEYNEFIMTEGIKITKLGITYSGFMYGVFSIFIIIVIKFWFGIEQSIFIFLILSMSEAVNNTGYSVYMTCLGIGKAFYLAVIQGLNFFLISISIVSGIWLFRGYLGLLGYFVSELIVNFFLLRLIRDTSGINISKYLKNIGINKLLISLVLTLAVIFLGINFKFNIYMLSSVLSLISFLLFWNETKQYIKMFGTLFTVSSRR